MPLTSCLVPARNEPYLLQTVADLFSKASGDIEVIVVLENYWPPDYAAFADRYPGKLHTIHHGQALGMRASINEAAALAKGDYLLKTDAHCLFTKGFDLQLMADIRAQEVMVPRRKRLDPDKWEVISDGRRPVDYEYLTYPNERGEMKGHEWRERAVERKDIELDETMLSQGSCWFMAKSYFYDLELMDEQSYGTFWKEMLEVGLKCWLSGGRVVTNKRTWYAHWHKKTRGYSLPDEENLKAIEFSRKWLTDSTGWKKQTRTFASFIEQFNPPGWENWKEGTNVGELQTAAAL